jgi:prepilin-type N-terminal cleavage/methylation domain-containing protein
MNKQSGFTLIEVAIVMVIIGLMLGSLLGPLGNRMEQTKIEGTGQQIDGIIEAIHGFAAINGRLPCPANLTAGPNFGREALTGTNCTTATGLGEPAWATLGTDRLDAWGQPFVYRVDPSFANNVLTGGTTTPAPFPVGCITSATASFSMCSTGNIIITNGAGGLPANSALAQAVPAIIVSRGKPKTAALTHVDETENTDGDVNFVSRDMRPETAPAPFNDIVRWIPTNVLIGKMVQAQRLP